ncbi:MAG: aspartate/glutamate racemase family protein [Acidovorax sp.]|uniref:aspartate/glutamate racemase family protein n=1 Tax=Acidovorax sp. TaxID=1872122 RepID=UPI0039E6BA4B
MPDILLINPNTSEATTAMMAALLARHLPPGYTVTGRTAEAGAPMIVNEDEMRCAAAEAERVWQRHAHQPWAGVVVSAFGDPGMPGIRAQARVPVAGICEASLLEAAQGGRRRFGIATVTPGLARLIGERVDELGLSAAYTGIRLTPGDPRALAERPAALRQALKDAVHACIAHDGAQAVVIGGGPLGEAAHALQAETALPLIAPLASAARDVLRRIKNDS